MERTGFLTKWQLEQYRSMIREIAVLECLISEYSEDRPRTAAGARGTSRLSKRSVLPCENRAISRLNARKACLKSECRRVEEFIEACEDKTLKVLLAQRYLKGKTLKEAAESVRMSRKQVSRLLKNFFEKMSPDVPKCP